MNALMKGVFVVMLVLGAVAFAREGKQHAPKAVTQTKQTAGPVPCPPYCTVDYSGHTIDFSGQ